MFRVCGFRDCGLAFGTFFSAQGSEGFRAFRFGGFWVLGLGLSGLGFRAFRCRVRDLGFKAFRFRV